MIEKFKNKSEYFGECKYIFNANKLNINLTAEEVGLENLSNIFCVDITKIKIIFKINVIKGEDFSIRIPLYNKKVSKLIEMYLDESGLTRSDIINFYYNGQILNDNLTIEEAGLKDNSEIFVKKQGPINSISITFKTSDLFKGKNKKTIKIECLLTEKIKYIIERYKYRTNNLDKDIKFSFNSKEIRDYNRVNEEGLENNSIIIVE